MIWVTGEGRSSTGVVRFDQEVVGKLLCQVTEAERVSWMVAKNLPVVEDHRERIGHKANHDQHDQRAIVTLMNRRMFQVAIDGDGLKDFGINYPTTLAQLINKDRGNGIDFHIAGEKVSALPLDQILDGLLFTIVVMYTDLIDFLGS